MSKILGIDCSSTTIGWCMLEITNNKINYLNSGYFKPIKKGNIFERLDHTRKKIKEILNTHNPDYVAIEDIIEFMAGKSSSKTITTLAVYNRNVGMTIYDHMNQAPELFNVMQIRHGLKINKIFPKKEDIPQLVSTHLGITFPYEHNRNGKIKVENYDRADAIAVALYYAFKLTGKVKKK